MNEDTNKHTELIQRVAEFLTPKANTSIGKSCELIYKTVFVTLSAICIGLIIGLMFIFGSMLMIFSVPIATIKILCSNYKKVK